MIKLFKLSVLSLALIPLFASAEENLQEFPFQFIDDENFNGQVEFKFGGKAELVGDLRESENGPEPSIIMLKAKAVEQVGETLPRIDVNISDFDLHLTDHENIFNNSLERVGLEMNVFGKLAVDIDFDKRLDDPYLFVTVLDGITTDSTLNVKFQNDKELDHVYHVKNTNALWLHLRDQGVTEHNIFSEGTHFVTLENAPISGLIYLDNLGARQNINIEKIVFNRKNCFTESDFDPAGGSIFVFRDGDSGYGGNLEGEVNIVLGVYEGSSVNETDEPEQAYFLHSKLNKAVPLNFTVEKSLKEATPLGIVVDEDNESGATINFNGEVDLKTNALMIDGSGHGVLVMPTGREDKRRVLEGDVLLKPNSCFDVALENENSYLTGIIHHDFAIKDGEATSKSVEEGGVESKSVLTLAAGARWNLQQKFTEDSLGADEFSQELLKSVSKLSELNLNSGIVDVTGLWPESGEDSSTQAAARSVAPADPVSSGEPDTPAELTIGKLTGEGGTFKLKFSPADQKSQHIHILHSSEGEYTLHMVSDQSAPDVSEDTRILVVENASNDRDKFRADFKLAGDVAIVGGEYKSYKLDHSDKDWFLIPSTDPYVPDDAVDVSALTDSARGSLGIVSVHHIGATSGLDTLRQRLGAAHRLSVAPGSTTPWVRVNGARWKAASKSLATGLKLDEGLVEVGFDHQLGDTLVGAFVDYVHGDAKMAAGQKIRTNGARAGVYATHSFENGAWVDVVGRFGYDRSRLRMTEGLDNTSVKADGVEGVYGNLSVEVGHSIDLADSWRVEPHVQVVYTRSGKVTVVNDQGLRLEAKAHSDVMTRVGALVEKSITNAAGSDIRAYGKFAWECDWSRAPEMLVNGAKTFRPDWKGNRFVYGLGIEGTTEKKHTWHASVEQSRGGAFRNDVRVDLGMRFNF